MHPDILSVVLRSASFIALFQAAGIAIFVLVFGRPLAASLPAMRRITLCCAVTAMVLLVGQYAMEAARMADDLAGLWDPSLQMIAMHSANSLVLAVRLVGLTIIVAGVGRRGVGTRVAVLGVILLAASFMLTGHTAASPLRWVLAPLLTLHVLIVTFWFGALVPLYLICTRETAAIAGQVTESFSKAALWLVPGILGAGLLLGVGLISHRAEFRTGYGLSLLAKLAGFAALMGLAALNKWYLGPALAIGDARVLRWFCRSLAGEYVLIAVVLSITAMMTTLYSPQT